MKARRSLLLAGLMMGLLFQSGLKADDEQMTTVVYPITFGVPAALEEICKTIVGEEGHVVLDEKRSRLIIVTTQSNHKELEGLLSPPELMPANISIAVNIQSTKNSYNKKAAVQGSGGIIFESGKKTSGTITLNPQLENSSTEMSSAVGQHLLVANGKSASLRVGEEVPYAAWLTDYGWRHGVLESQIAWQEVGSFLTVSPTILSDGRTIRVVLTPQLRGLVDGNPFHASFVELSTEVVVQSGQSIRIGGAGKDQEFYSKFLVGFGRQGVVESLNIELTPTIRETLTPPK